MKPTKASQPYRADRARNPGPALDAMRRGTTFGGINPSHTLSQLHALAQRFEAQQRRERAEREPRRPRPKRWP